MSTQKKSHQSAITKEIPLTRSLVALVDNRDFEILKQFRWQAHKNKTTFYASMAKKRGCRWRTIYMHRLIMSVLPGIEVDHINGDGLDNRRCNLRLCTRIENNRNCRKQQNRISGFKGVTRYCKQKKWIAKIQSHYLGSFETEEAAATVYNKAAEKIFGHFARLNIIDIPKFTTEVNEEEKAKEKAKAARANRTKKKKKQPVATLDSAQK